MEIDETVSTEAIRYPRPKLPAIFSSLFVIKNIEKDSNLVEVECIACLKIAKDAPNTKTVYKGDLRSTSNLRLHYSVSIFYNLHYFIYLF